jgi:hypothetical protein
MTAEATPQETGGDSTRERVEKVTERQKEREMETPGKGGRLKDPEKEAARRRKISESHKRRIREKKEAEEPKPITPEEVQAYGTLGATVWGLVGPFAGVGPLDGEQTLALGGALAPLGRKYVPFLDRWQEEINAVVVVVSLYHATKLPSEPQEAGSDAGGPGGGTAGA